MRPESSDHFQTSLTSVPCAVVTVSDTRTSETDTSGALIRERLIAAGHSIHSTIILPDDSSRVGQHVSELCSDPECRAVLLTGGTGLAARDTTYEAVAALLEKRLDGFGELFRMLSFEEIGPAAMLSRAVAGIRGNTLIFSMPGSTAAVRLAMDRLILPSLVHIVSLLDGPPTK